MARTLKTYTCIKCGLPFTKWVGGIVLTPKEKELMIRPVCDNCKSKTIGDIMKRFTKQEG